MPQIPLTLVIRVNTARCLVIPRRVNKKTNVLATSCGRVSSQEPAMHPPSSHKEPALQFNTGARTMLTIDPEVFAEDEACFEVLSFVGYRLVYHG